MWSGKEETDRERQRENKGKRERKERDLREWSSWWLVSSPSPLLPHVTCVRNVLAKKPIDKVYKGIHLTESFGVKFPPIPRCRNCTKHLLIGEYTKGTQAWPWWQFRLCVLEEFFLLFTLTECNLLPADAEAEASNTLSEVKAYAKVPVSGLSN